MSWVTPWEYPMVTASAPPPRSSRRKQAYEARETVPSRPLLEQARKKVTGEWSSHHLFQSQHGTLYATSSGEVPTTSIGLGKKVGCEQRPTGRCQLRANYSVSRRCSPLCPGCQQGQHWQIRTSGQYESSGTGQQPGWLWEKTPEWASC